MINSPSLKYSHNPKNTLKRGQHKFIAASLIPIVSLLIIFALVPIAMGLWLSLYNYNPLNVASPFVGFGNFKEMMTDTIFHKALFNTLIFVLISVPGNIIITLPVALAINAVSGKKLKDTFRTIFFLPTVTPIVAAALIWASIYDPSYGLLNMILSSFGINRIYWLSDPRTAMLSVIVVTLWQDMGYNIVIFLSGLESIPKMFYEAADLDGANRWTVFTKITLPLLSRTTLFIVVMTTISYFQVFTQVQIMTNGGPNYATQTLALSIYQNAFVYSRMGYASAMAVVLMVIILMVSLIQMRLMRNDWEY